MSKGHGRVERAILEVLSKRRGHHGRFNHGADTETLAQYVRSGKAFLSASDPYWRRDPVTNEARWGPPITRSELESVRRALRNLKKQGLVLPVLRLQRIVYEEAPEESNMRTTNFSWKQR